METTEKIVDSYCRYVKGWFTIPNIKCKGQYEIDLLAVDISGPEGIKRYHIECGVSISGSYSKLTAKEFSREDIKKRTQQAGQRRTIGYFIERKFGQQEVLDRLSEYGLKFHRDIGVSPKRAADSLGCWLRGGVLGETRVELGLR